jgi:hypothetical protein
VRHFKTLLQRADLPNIRFHDLRHGCATVLISQGVHPRIVMEIMGHSQISVTMNAYGHRIPEVNRDALNSLGDLVKPQMMNIPRRVKKTTKIAVNYTYTTLGTQKPYSHHRE